MNELDENNYLKRNRIYQNGKIVDWEYVIYESNLYRKNEDIENEDIEICDLEKLNTKKYTNNNYITNNILKNKKEKVKKEKFIPPTLEEVKKYAETRGRIDLADKFYDYFNAGEWIDSKGNKVKNWKQKFITWEDNNKPVYQQKENIKCSAKQLDNGVWKI